VRLVAERLEAIPADRLPGLVIELFIGSSIRCWPGMSAVNPSVQRNI
jgi:hypothetical protein